MRTIASCSECGKDKYAEHACIPCAYDALSLLLGDNQAILDELIKSLEAMYASQHNGT